jgi:pimeloyl-ACP methyl ester carboxylesterase
MRFSLPILIASIAFSCASAPKEKSIPDSVQPTQITQPVLNPGSFTEHNVTGDPENLFSVYVPKNYDSSKKWPVVIFFDAHANGKLPMNKYKSLSEKWGYVFVGSNTSKNGMAGDRTRKIGNALIEEVKKLVSVEETEIILCGFSGGARVASNIAISRPDIKALICNSAAPSEPMNGRIFVGLAGLGDMNYLELKSYTTSRGHNGSPNELLVFDGKHEWAPVGMMEDAFLIASVTPLNGISNPNAAEMFRTLGALIYAQSDSIKKISCMISNDLLLTGKRAQDAAALSSNVRIVSSDDSRISAPKANACVTADQAVWAAAEAEETVLQQELASAMMSQDTTWWKTNAPKYFESKKEGADKFMHQRLRGYASLMCYSYANQAFKANNLHAAEKLVAIYAIVDPTNSEWAYMRANLYMQLSLKDYAISSLEKAVALGFNDKNRLQNDPVFYPVIADARVAALLGNMK